MFGGLLPARDRQIVLWLDFSLADATVGARLVLGLTLAVFAVQPVETSKGRATIGCPFGRHDHLQGKSPWDMQTGASTANG